MVIDERLLAAWVLGEITPEEVPERAVAAMVSGCAAPVVVRLAGLIGPTSSDVYDVLYEFGVRWPSDEAALRVRVAEIALQIVDGLIAPDDGADIRAAAAAVLTGGKPTLPASV